MSTVAMQFGLSNPQAGLSWAQMVERAQLADRLGFHSIWSADHFWRFSEPERDFFECLTLLSGLAASTKRVRIGSSVICHSYRNPALLAKALSTLDHVSGGRLEIGIGAGHRQPEYLAYGYEFPGIGTRIRQLEEGLQILKAMFTQEQASFEGRYFKVREAWNNPKPLQKPHPPITIGGSGEKLMLPLVAKYADRWLCIAGDPRYRAGIGILKERCAELGRDFNTLQVGRQILLCMGRTAAEAEEQWERWLDNETLGYLTNTAIKGTPAQVIEQIHEQARLGVSLLIIHIGEAISPADMELFAREVMPAFA